MGASHMYLCVHYSARLLHDPNMSALGHKRKWCHARVMSVLPLKAGAENEQDGVVYITSA
jgi:hypothetical protein